MQAERALAALAIEMHVRVVMVHMIMAVAQFISHPFAPILNDMHQFMAFKLGQCPEHTRLVDGQYHILQLLDRQWAVSLCQSARHHYAVGSGLDASVLQHSYYFVCVHNLMNNGAKVTKKCNLVATIMIYLCTRNKKNSNDTVSADTTKPDEL